MVMREDPVERAGECDLLADARAGGAGAFCFLIRPLEARLLRQAMGLTNDLCAAEDLVSEVRIRAWKNLARYNETCRLSTWLYAILLHCHQEAARRARSRPISLARIPAAEAAGLHERQESDPATELSPADTALRNEAAMQLNHCVQMLPEKHREIIQLRFFEDASLPDMAAVLSCSVGTVKSRLHHALEKLRKMKMNLPDTRRHQQV
jgi:RNA polymerase sigma-70 factor (ECF subfamily)